MHRTWRSILTALAAALTAAAGSAPASAATPAAPAVPAYDHVFVVVEENHGFTDVIGNPAAPNLNALARTFGLATSYFAVAHPSEPNYVALAGGSTFGIADDNPYFVNAVAAPSLVAQLDAAGIPWKAYLQGVPHPGYRGTCGPVRCGGSPDGSSLYASKHNGIVNFTTAHDPSDWDLQVPIEQLDADLRTGGLPRLGWVIPDQCHDMHGAPPYCVDAGPPFSAQDQRLVAAGDRTLGQLVGAITGAPFWARGNNAIAVVFDEGDDNAGCCAANPGGGQTATVVITSHGPRGLQDPTPYNHYSLLQTLQRSFGLGCLAFTCDTADVRPMAPLFAVTGARSVATSPLPTPDVPTPSAPPAEPASLTTATPAAAGWQVVPTPQLGGNDNSLGAVAAAAPDDVWAVGDFLPDTPDSNQFATLALAAHFDGTSWTSTPVPDAGPNLNVLLGVAAAGGRAWAVGVRLDANFHDRALIEAWDGSRWSIAAAPDPGAQRDLLFGASALSPSDVWAVGERQDAGGRFATLVEHWDGDRWSVVPSADPGRAGDHLYGVAAVGHDDVWAVGQRLDPGADRALIEHWDGQRWSVVAGPATRGDVAALYGVAAAPDGRVAAVGQTTGAVEGTRPLAVERRDGVWRTAPVGATGSMDTELWSVAMSGDTTWAVGTLLVPDGTNRTVVVRGDGGEGGFQVVHAPDPGAVTDLLGGVAAAGGSVWAAGNYVVTDVRLTLVERHQ